MVTLIPTDMTSPVWKTIDLGDDDNIEIAIRKPTLGDQLDALSGAGGDSLLAFRVKSSIVDWRGVVDQNGKPVPFNWDSLNALCFTYQAAIWSILESVREVTRPAEDHLKNSPLPPVAGGTETTTETTTATESLSLPVTCDGSTDYDKHSASQDENC